MSDLTNRVHARIGTSGTVNANRFPGESFDRTLDRPLHGRLFRLDLPTRIVRALVGDGQTNVPQGCHILFPEIAPQSVMTMLRIRPGRFGEFDVFSFFLHFRPGCRHRNIRMGVRAFVGWD